MRWTVCKLNYWELEHLDVGEVDVYIFDSVDISCWTIPLPVCSNTDHTTSEIRYPPHKYYHAANRTLNHVMRYLFAFSCQVHLEFEQSR